MKPQTVRATTRHPLRVFRDYLKVRRFFNQPLQVAALRQYKGDPSLKPLIHRDGRTLSIRAGTMDRHIVWSVFLKDAYRLAKLPCETLETVVDIGAHIGCFSFRIAPRAKRVIAFEPVPANHQLAARNLAGEPHRHIDLIQAAVSDVPGELSIFLSDGNSAGHSAFPAPDAQRDRTTLVEAVRLSDVLEDRGIDRVDFLKVDCEGAEYAIMSSIEDWGYHRFLRMVLEYHPVEGRSESDSGPGLEERLKERGFAVCRVPAEKQDYGLIFAEQPDLPLGWISRQGATGKRPKPVAVTPS